MSDARQPDVDFLLAFLGNAFAQIVGQIVFMRVKTLCNTNLVTSRHIHYFHIDHNAPCLPPPKFCISIVSNFVFFGGGVGEGVNKVRYGLCENGEYGKRPHFRLTCVTNKRPSLSFPLVSTGTVESTKNTLGSLSNNNGDGNENIT